MRWDLWRTLMTAKRWIGWSAIAALLGIAIVVLASSCGQSTSSATVPTPSAATNPTPAASPPPGGPVPAQLLGDWFLPPAAVEAAVGVSCPSPQTTLNCFYELTLAPTSYRLVFRDASFSGAGGGDAVVNNNEIDFFNGVNCGLQLPDGVGRYTWTLTGGLLTLTLISDPCGRPSGQFTQRD
jgi:hypothetical protein